MEIVSFEPLTEAFWSKSLAAYSHAWARCPEHELCRDDTPARAIFPLANSVLAELVGHSGMRIDKKAEIFRYNLHPGIHLAFHSGPVAGHIQFGIWADHWFIETLLPYFDSIPNVTEDFWTGISEICHLAQTTFEENTFMPRSSPEQKRLFKSGRSIHYRIVRNFVLLRSQTDLDSNDACAMSPDIGNLSSKVSIDSSFTECLGTLRQLYKQYYRCLQHLYRCEYQKSRRSRTALD